MIVSTEQLNKLNEKLYKIPLKKWKRGSTWNSCGIEYYTEIKNIKIRIQWKLIDKNFIYYVQLNWFNIENCDEMAKTFFEYLEEHTKKNSDIIIKKEEKDIFNFIEEGE